MYVYSDMFDGRYNQLKHDYAHANARGYHRPSTLRAFLRRIAAR